MASERIEIVLKTAKKVEELRAERTRLTTEIDRQITAAEAELTRLIGGGSDFPAQLGEAAAEHLTGTHQDRVVAILERVPRASVSEMAVQLYGDAEDTTKHKIRSLLWTLKKRGRIQKTAYGYEVVK